jgi:hypothetical protein
MKIYALYLPQFHETEENNKWWGKGFTEWVNVKNASSLYEGHIQPKRPLNGNYYNLMEKEIVVWQTKLMHDYGIDGLIYYHYYFNGKMILEKPAENLLKWKDIDQPFFFNWANHSWNRSWNGSRELLVEQTYGSVDDWKKHFGYLLPFFKDGRYVKIDNKPVFIIYTDFKEKNEMFNCFNKWCKEAGFSGLYLVEECFSICAVPYDKFITQKADITQKIYLTEPLVGRALYNNKKPQWEKFIDKVKNRLNQKGIIKVIKKYNGDDLLKLMMDTKEDRDDIIPGLFFEWDNTPRHGNRGYIINPVSKDIFTRYMDKYKNRDFIIINAWNEWCEGMMLEPTEENGYRYLEWIKEWKSSYKI